MEEEEENYPTKEGRIYLTGQCRCRHYKYALHPMFVSKRKKIGIKKRKKIGIKKKEKDWNCFIFGSK